ncbi:hypothetical protein PHYSODRAFT_303524 [Phytophthora sojae]|uniref:Uncharacterized protein n=1 Tax=Phytophthora sojae (strain P6497) TaxID=1094619 RepID=G4ZVF0_PHYSP|nr:hypothetical protein PHYSODRAFT_303524 [Phytophthora sojae]EGZ11468.1 hypothetical protein PHYSODRAFT_303524 [Phytophthora sojae]|eukprot:XP_009531801.1 hypothetical protein PHYSODRAFT_303524 [Phytophthora sojae]
MAAFLGPDVMSWYRECKASTFIEIPGITKRWFYQQNIRADTNSYIRRNFPVSQQDTIEHVQLQRYPQAKSNSPVSRSAKRYCQMARTVTSSQDAAAAQMGLHKPGQHRPAASRARSHQTVRRKGTGAKKLGFSGGWCPADKGCTTENHTAEPQSLSATQHSFAYERDDALLSRQEKSFIVPETQDLLLGMPSLVEANPLIDWSKRVISPRSSPKGDQRAKSPPGLARPAQQALPFKPCVPRQRARLIAGQRSLRIQYHSEDLAPLQVYLRHGHDGNQDRAQIVRSRDIPKLLGEEVRELCLFISSDTASSKTDDT